MSIMFRLVLIYIWADSEVQAERMKVRLNLLTFWSMGQEMVSKMELPPDNTG